MVALVNEALVFRPTLRAAFVVNRRVTRTTIGREARAALTEPHIAPLAAEVFQRIVFAESVAAGRLAFELDADSPAAREIAALAAEVLAPTR
jgi:chromosome partitioning protein